MADLYRKSSLERISSPEQLDKVLKVTSPMSWLALIALTVMIVIITIWSFVGTIPETITAKGVVSSSTVGSNSVYIQEAGTIVSVRVRAGQELHLGDPVVTYKNAGNEMITIYSDQVGTVSALAVNIDDKVNPGKDIIRVTPSVSNAQMVVCYVSLSQAKKLTRGMTVNITMDSLDGTSYGHMEGRIVNIDAYATPIDGIYSVIGSGNNLESTFTSNGAVVAVACELYTSRDTVSGLYWSAQKGATVSVTNGSLVTAKIVTEEIAPITKLFSKLRDIWGD